MDFQNTSNTHYCCMPTRQSFEALSSYKIFKNADLRHRNHCVFITKTSRLKLHAFNGRIAVFLWKVQQLLNSTGVNSCSLQERIRIRQHYQYSVGMGRPRNHPSILDTDKIFISSSKSLRPTSVLQNWSGTYLEWGGWCGWSGHYSPRGGKINNLYKQLIVCPQRALNYWDK